MKKKVLYVFGGEESSGAEYVIERLVNSNDSCENFLIMSPGNYASKLKEKQKKYTLILDSNLKKINKAKSSKINYLIVFIKNLYGINKHIFYLIKHKKIDVVHCNTIVPAVYVLPILCIFKIFWKQKKWIWSDHDLDYAGSGILLKVSKVLAKLYDATLVVSNAVKNKYELNEKIKLLYNGLDINDIKIEHDLREGFRENLRIPSTAFVYGIIGQIIGRKGVLNLLKVFVEYYNSGHADSYLLVAGTPPSKNDSYYLKCLKISENCKNIIFTGFIDDIAKFYNGLDVVINNSSLEGSEPLGTTILEGLAYGKIVMASNVGGSAEIIKNKQNGFLYDADDKNALKKALIACQVLSISEREAMRSHALKTIKNQFHIDIMLNNYLKILD